MSDLVLAAEVYHSDQADRATLLPSVLPAQINLVAGRQRSPLSGRRGQLVARVA